MLHACVCGQQEDQEIGVDHVGMVNGDDRGGRASGDDRGGRASEHDRP
jgi:hypothetical protein